MIPDKHITDDELFERATGLGGVLQLEDREYRISEPIVVMSCGLEIRGPGGHREYTSCCITQTSQDTNAIKFGPHSALRLRNVRIKGQHPHQTIPTSYAAGIYIDDSEWCANLDIENVEIRGFPYGVRTNMDTTSKGIGHLTITNSTIRQNHWGVWLDGLQLSNTTIRIRDSKIRANGCAGFSEPDYKTFEQGGGLFFRCGTNIIVEGNTLESQPTGLFAENTKSMIIDGNYFEANKSASIIVRNCREMDLRPQYFGRESGMVVRLGCD